jgi:hypothetical protein
MEIDNNQIDSIVAEHKKVTELLKELNRVKESLTKKENDLSTEYSELNKTLVKINKEILIKKDEIEKIINGDNANDMKFSSEYLDKKSMEVFRHFVTELKNVNNLQFKIEYEKISLVKQLKDDRIKFADLKQEMKLHIGKKEDEFYFVDENGSIFLDNMNIKCVLFPLSKINIINYLPIIRVVNKSNKIDNLNKIQLIDDNKANTNENKIYHNSNREYKFRWKDKILKYFSIFAFFMFIFCYIQSVIFYRNIENYKNIIDSLKNFKKFSGNSIAINYTQKNIGLNYIVNILCTYFQILTKEELENGYSYPPDSIHRKIFLNSI